MSVTILKDTEEALLREFRNILQAEQRTLTYQALPSLFDPFSGEKVEGNPLEAYFYDSSAQARNIEYPHVFVKILRSEEDLTSGRIVPPYGNEVTIPVSYASRAYQVVLSGTDLVRTAGNTLTTSNLKVKLLKPGQLLSVLNGPNVGTYIIQLVTLNGNGPHTVTLSANLVTNLPVSNFKQFGRVLTFLSPVDLNTVAAGDILTDSLANTFVISAIDVANNAIILASGSLQPSIASGSFISRPGNVLPTVDATPRNFLVLDPTKPIVGKGLLEIDSTVPNTDQNKAIDWAIPLDLVFGIIIDTKAFEDHTAVWNRVWEEFNPPRRGLSIIVRSPQSAETHMVENFKNSSSQAITVKDSSTFIVGETVRIFNRLTTGLESQIISINSDTNTLMLADSIPNTFTVQNGTKVVSNTTLVLWEWDFLSHRDNSNDGSHYWSHAYEYRVQVWVDKKNGEQIYGVIKQIQGTIEDFESNVLGSIKVP